MCIRDRRHKSMIWLVENIFDIVCQTQHEIFIFETTLFSTTTWVHNSKSFFISFYTKTTNHVQRQLAPVVQREHHGIIAKALQNNKKADSLILSWHFRCNSRRTSLKSLEAMRRCAEYTDILYKTNWGIEALIKRLKHQLFSRSNFHGALG